MALDFQYDELMLRGSALRPARAGAVTYGFEFDLRYPSYRGTFLSCIEALEVAVDGLPVPPEDMRLTLNGKQFLLSELSELCHEYWYVLDAAVLTVLRDGGLAPGGHEVSVKMTHRVPYTGYFGQYLVLDSAGALSGNIA